LWVAIAQVYRLLFLSLFATTVSANAQLSDCSGHAGSWWSLDRIDLLQTFDKKVATLPAAFAYTLPDSGKRSYTINAALRYNLPLNERYTVGPTIEESANTSSAKRQDFLKAGITGDFELADPCTRPKWVPLFTSGAEFTRDKIKAIGGFLFQAQFTPVPYGRHQGLWYLANQVFRVGSAASVVLTPYLGLEYQAADSVGSRSALRGKGSYAANVNPWPHFFGERLTLQVTEEVRDDWLRSGITGGRSTRWFVASADFVLLDQKTSSGKARNASFGVTYQNGANPTQGFEQQALTQLLFKVQF
jgi:hypothetical protein